MALFLSPVLLPSSKMDAAPVDKVREIGSAIGSGIPSLHEGDHVPLLFCLRQMHLPHRTDFVHKFCGSCRSNLVIFRREVAKHVAQPDQGGHELSKIVMLCIRAECTERKPTKTAMCRLLGKGKTLLHLNMHCCIGVFSASLIKRVSIRIKTNSSGIEVVLVER